MKSKLLSIILAVTMIFTQVSLITVNASESFDDDEGTVILRPIDATYVSQHGDDNETNYYGSSVMYINNTSHNSGTTDYGQYGYMKFDLDGIPKERISSATLRVYVENDGDKSSSTRTIGIYDTCGTDWTGSTLTWSNNPYMYAKNQLGTFSVTADGTDITDAGWREIDITDYVRDNIEDELSFMAKMTTWPAYNVAISSGTYSGDPDDFDSSVYNENMPQIEIEYCSEALTPYSSTVLTPSRDTYIDQHTASTNYLSDEYMKVNSTEDETRSDKYGCYSYMDFDISGVDAESISSAKLWIYVDANSDVRRSTRTIGIFTPSATWSDSITWSNGRVSSSGDAVGTYTVTGNDFDIVDYGWKCIDLTDYLTDYMSDNSSDTLSLMMKSIDSSAHPVLIRSSEYSDESTRPKLVVNMLLLPVAGLMADSTETIEEHSLNDDEFELFALEEATNLPTSVDLTDKFPVSHATGQGSIQNNCAVWAVGYYLKAAQENNARNWGLDSNEHLFSPSFIYNQMNSGSCKTAVSIGGIMGFIIENGVCTLKSFPYKSSDYTTQPSTDQINEAGQFKSIDWYTIKGVEEIKSYIAGGSGVVIGIRPLKQFYSIYSNPYTKLNSTVQVYNDPESPIYKEGAAHALCLIGYDDSLNAFKFVNSWNANYGYYGYGWISYEMIEDSRVNLHDSGTAFVLQSRDSFSINVKPTVIANNSESESGGSVTGEGIYDYADIVKLTATPNTGYDFIGWYEDGKVICSDENLYGFPAVANRTIEARFMKSAGANEPIYIMVTAGEGGTVTGDGIYEYGDTVVLEATSDDGYTFDGWYENGVKVDNATSSYSFIAEEFRSLEANFKKTE